MARVATIWVWEEASIGSQRGDNRWFSESGSTWYIVGDDGGGRGGGGGVGNQ